VVRIDRRIFYSGLVSYVPRAVRAVLNDEASQLLDNFSATAPTAEFAQFGKPGAAPGD
jgi:hypothetical protein